MALQPLHEVEFGGPVHWHRVAVEKVRDRYEVPIGGELVSNTRGGVYVSYRVLFFFSRLRGVELMGVAGTELDGESLQLDVDKLMAEDVCHN